MGLRFYTDRRGIKVFRHEKDGNVWYNITIGKKEGDTWINVSKPIVFKDSPNIPDGTIVIIKDGFFDVATWVKNGVEYKRDKLIALDYEYQGQNQKPKPAYVEIPDYPDSFAAMDADLPF